jgi:VWFA-related protein
MGSIIPQQGGGQPRQEEGRIDLTSRSEMVVVPVVVRDGSGAPVKGLTKDDFTLLENGKEQKIAEVEEIKTNAAPLKRQAMPENQFSNIYVGSPEPRRVTIMVLDEINTPILDQTNARAQLVKYLSKSLSADDLIALMVMNRSGVHMIHDFSSNPEVLIAAVKKVSSSAGALTSADSAALASSADNSTLGGATPGGPGADVTPGDVGAEAVAIQTFIDQSDNAIATFRQTDAMEITFRNFLGMAQVFSGVPGRKSIVWLTSGIPIDLYDQANLPTGRDLSTLYERTLQAINQANIAVYPVDVRGLQTFGYGNASQASTAVTQTSFRTGGQVNVMASSQLEAANHTNLSNFAEMTGGRAFYNSNDLATGMQQASNDASDYYELRYYLDHKVYDAGWRKLKVKVSKPGVHVLARSGFWVSRATMDPEAGKNSDIDIQSALLSPLDSTAVPVGVRWLGFDSSRNSDKKRKMRFAVAVPAQTITIVGSDDTHFSVRLILTARGADGKSAASFDQMINGTNIKTGDVDKVRLLPFVHQGMLDLPPGDYSVRVVLRDNKNGKIGSLTAPLKVPEANN